MTGPHEMIAAITNLERELRDLGWRPVEMIDEGSGLPFTWWFPPKPPPVDREFLMDHMEFPPNFENGPNPLGEDY
ncbi:MAG: hypothetical protein OXE87_10860 [Chloroflexi bacterium]|nr:hypothetical protein [Chloroflexota bacterium]